MVPNGPAESPTLLIQTRAGHLTPLDPGRLEESLHLALSMIPLEDPMLPGEAVSVVRLAAGSRLQRRVAQGEPAPFLTVEALGELVEEALMQMGHVAAARAYILQRDRRSRARAALEVVAPDSDPLRDGRMPMVRDGSGTTPWNLTRIVSALMREAELPQEIAGEVARRVEKRVFDAGLRRLSSSLIRAFVDNELGAMGLEEALKRQEPVGIPRHDLRAVFKNPMAFDVTGFGNQPRGVVSRVGGELLRRFALEDILDPEIADLQKSGSLELENLDAPHRPVVLAIPCELLLRGAPSVSTPMELLGAVAPILSSTSQGVVLEDLNSALAGIGRGARAAAVMREFLLAASALIEATGKPLDLSSPGGRGERWAAVLLQQAGGLLHSGTRLPRLFLEISEVEGALTRDPELQDPIESLLASGQLVPVWHGGGDRYVGPGCRRKGRERGALACGGAVSLNLPRLARSAGSWREERFLEQIVELLRKSVRALANLARFQSKMGEAGPVHLKSRTQYSVAPVGLLQALRILGDGELRADQGARVLGLMAEAAARFGREENLDVRLDSAFGVRASVRFARSDGDSEHPRQERLFSDLPMPEGERVAHYSLGFSGGVSGLGDQALALGRLTSSDASQAAADFLARLLVGVRSGALTTLQNPVSGPVDGDGSPVRPHLALWRRFDAVRSEHLEQSPLSSSTPAPSPSDGSLFGTLG
ncbi:MAG: hypothetical protein P1V35_02780 [Planctomycetota bacterium]|nr:hypothetical protein [Planctomycetota bacterium]